MESGSENRTECETNIGARSLRLQTHILPIARLIFEAPSEVGPLLSAMENVAKSARPRVGRRCAYRFTLEKFRTDCDAYADAGVGRKSDEKLAEGCRCHPLC